MYTVVAKTNGKNKKIPPKTSKKTAQKSRMKAKRIGLSFINQSWKKCANKTGMGLEDWTMKQNDGFGFGIWGVAEVVDVAVWPEATDDGGTGRSVNALAE